MRITVTQDDILNASCSGWNCPITRAAQRCFPNKVVYCNADHILVYTDIRLGAEFASELPSRAKMFVTEFDAASLASASSGLRPRLDPIEFEIEVPL